MNNAAAAALCDMIRDYGQSVANTPRMFETLLRQKARAFPDDVDVLLVALHYDVNRQLLDKPKQNRDALGRWLHEHTKLPEVKARWAVEAWAAALGLAPPPKPSTDWHRVLSSPEPSPIPSRTRRALFVAAAVATFAAAAAAAYSLGR